MSGSFWGQSYFKTYTLAMIVLGFESSCDETGVALVDASGDAVPRLLAHALYSQIDMHQAYGGVGCGVKGRWNYYPFP